MNDRTNVFVTGKVYWAKIFGEPRPNYDGDGREWTVEFVPDDTSFLKEHKLLDRLKDKPDDKNPDKGDYLVLRKKELTRDGKENDPIRVYNEDNEPWDSNQLLGNGTGVDAKLTIVDYGRGKKKGVYIQAFRVRDHVPYVSNEFGAMDSEDFDSPKTKPTKSKEAVADLPDDDLPFD